VRPSDGGARRRRHSVHGSLEKPPLERSAVEAQHTPRRAQRQGVAVDPHMALARQNSDVRVLERHGGTRGAGAGEQRPDRHGVAVRREAAATRVAVGLRGHAIVGKGHRVRDAGWGGLLRLTGRLHGHERPLAIGPRGRGRRVRCVGHSTRASGVGRSGRTLKVVATTDGEGSDRRERNEREE